MRYFLTGIIDRFENNKVVIVLEDNQVIIWPKKKLPKGIREGEGCKIFLKIDKKIKEKKIKVVKRLLKRLKK